MGHVEIRKRSGIKNWVIHRHHYVDVPDNAIGFAARGVAWLQFISDLIDAGVIAGDGAVPSDIDDSQWRGFSRSQSPFCAAAVGAGN